MKKSYILLSLSCLLLFVSKSNAQLGVVWEQNYGGSSNDFAFGALNTSDGGYIISGYTESSDVDVSEAFGVIDVWVLKTDADGAIEWEQSYGGSGKDFGRQIVETGDGGYVVVGSTESLDGDITDNSGLRDAWVIKIADDGTLLWQFTYGGDLDDLFNSVIPTSDGGFLCVGSSESANGDLTENKGVDDVWIVKLNSDGTLDWQKSLGGSHNDVANAAMETDDAYVIAADASSNDFDVTGNHIDGAVFFNDAWVIKLEKDGDLIWEQCYGGFVDDFGKDIIELSDGNYLLASAAKSDAGDVSAHYGTTARTDLWLVELTDAGAIVEDHNYGGTANDDVFSITNDLDGGFLLTGQTNSTDIDVSGHHGSASSTDFWVFKVNTDYTIAFSSSIGGSQDDVGQVIIPFGVDDYTAIGFSKSSTDDVGANYGSQDVWLAHLGPCSLEITADPLDVETCAGSDVTLTVEISGSASTYTWVFLGGPTLTTGSNVLNVTDVTTAYSHDYFVIVSGACGTDTSEEATLFVEEFPAPDISPATTTSLCGVGFVIFSTTATGVSYQWYKDAVAIAGATTATYVATSAGVYYVNTYNDEGCSSNSTSVTLTNDGAVATVTLSGATNICATGSLTMTTITGVGYTYQWYKDAVAIAGATLSSYTATAVGNYYVVVDASGCTSTSTTVAVTNEGPIATIAATGSLDLCLTGSVTLNSTTTGSGLTYQWLKDNSPLVGAVGVSLVAIDTGDYSLQVVNLSGCKDTSLILHVFNSCTPIHDEKAFQHLSINPNPSDGIFEIHFENSDMSENIQLQVINITGSIIHSTTLPNAKNINYQLNITDMPAGNYVLRLLSGSTMMMRKIVIQ